MKPQVNSFFTWGQQMTSKKFQQPAKHYLDEPFPFVPAARSSGGFEYTHSSVSIPNMLLVESSAREAPEKMWKRFRNLDNNELPGSWMV